MLFTGIGAAVAMAKDVRHGFVDRLRSLPIPRSSVLAARALADTALGPSAETLLGHPAGYFVTRALLWAAAILAVAVPLAVARYRRG